MKQLRKIVAILSATCMLAVFAGCEAVSVNRDKDMAQTVAQIGDVKITKKEVYEEVAPSAEAQDIDVYDEKLSSDVRDSLDEYMVEQLDSMVEQEVIKQMFDKKEMKLTEEEEKEAQEQIENNITMIREMYLGYDSDKPDEYDGDIEADVEAYFAEQGTTVEEYKVDYLETLLNTAKADKLKEEATKETEAAEEDVKKKYDTDLAAQKDVFKNVSEATASPTASAEASASPSPSASAAPEGTTLDSARTSYEELAKGGANGAGSYVLYKPEGYRVVKHILLEFTKEDTAKLEEFDKRVSDVEEEAKPVTDKIGEAQSALSAAETAKKELEDGEAPEEQADKDALQAQIDEQQKIIDEQNAILTEQEALNKPFDERIAVIEKEKADYRVVAGNNLAAKVKEIKDKYNAGTDFNTLIDEYNTDDGMKDGAGKAYGYLVTPTGEGFVSEFSQASLGLNTAGELTDGITSEYGVHIIRLEMGTAEADMPYETVKPVIKETLDEEAKTTKWDETMEEWEKELGVKRWDKRLKFLVR